ncbi:hypothetical protein VNO77_43292 [Canavalia gladiata]|uniref:Uncharacterized protein n=1 Tax=Canavalia gladiata TaxID=3824 RepID=A0AAN9PPT6_CANGL
MKKASLMFSCLLVLFLVAYETDFVKANACEKCGQEDDCYKLHCFGRCVKECIDGCCGCNCRPPTKMLDKFEAFLVHN